jgi:hypothetical protein
MSNRSMLYNQASLDKFCTVIFPFRYFVVLIHYIGQICIMLCADHGPCVSGAHNTIVTARAGKDLVSSLVSGKYMPFGLFTSEVG